MALTQTGTKCAQMIYINSQHCPLIWLNTQHGNPFQLNTFRKCVKSLRLRSLLCLRSFLWQKLSGCRDFFPLSFPFDKQTKNMITWYHQPKMINVKTSLKSSKATSWRGVAYKLHVIGAPLETQRQRNLIGLDFDAEYFNFKRCFCKCTSAKKDIQLCANILESFLRYYD